MCSALRKTICILLTCAFVCAAVFPAFAGTPAEDAHLHFNADGNFRILNFSDIQDDETLDLHVKTFLRQAVCVTQPDLIVLTGDNIFGPAIDQATDENPNPTKTAIAQFMDVFEELGIPVAIVFGNHDDDHENGSHKGYPLLKDDQLEIYNNYKVNISYDEDSSLSGCGTYNVPIYGSTETDKIKFNLWMFDTGSDKSVGGTEDDYMRDDQLDWYVAKSNELKAANGGRPVPSIAFQHIIVKEIYDALKAVPRGTPGSVYYNMKMKYYVLPETAAAGSVMNEHPSCCTMLGHEFSVVKQQGDVQAIVCGHDHENCFIVPYQGIDLINTPGMSMMFEDYGDASIRGARIIDINETKGTYTTEMLNMRELLKPEYSIPADAGSKYISRIALCVARSAWFVGSVDDALDAAYNRVYAAVDAAHGNGVALREDLNGGETSDKNAFDHYVICMGYTFTDDPAKAMRGLGLCYTGSAGASGTPYDGTSAGGVLWNLCNVNSLLVSGTDGAVDLNAGTDGSSIYFVANYSSSGSPLTEIRIENTGFDRIETDEYSGYDLARAVLGNIPDDNDSDLNRSALGNYVYALYRTAAEGAARLPLDSLPLHEAYFRARERLKHPETLYSAQSMAALTSALAQADAIFDDLQNDRQTTVYDQAALDSTAQQIMTCLQNLATATFTVTFDPDGGVCDEESRTIVYGTACGTLPTARRSRYTLAGWFTEPDGCGERITADTVYTIPDDRTWYAFWQRDLLWLAGDADENGSVDLRDVVVFQRYLAGGWDAHVDFDHADVNADGKLDLRDVMLLRRFLACGWNVVLV